jgi:hypothetical protein
LREVQGTREPNLEVLRSYPELQSVKQPQDSQNT